MPVVLKIDNKTTDHFEITVTFNKDALSKVGPCIEAGAPADLEGNQLIAFLFKQWCDHKASEWFAVLEKASVRVELAEAADDLGGKVTGPDPQATEERV